MVRVTCLSPMKGYSYFSSALAHLEILILQSSNNDPSTRNNLRANIQSKQKDTTKNITPNKRKALRVRTWVFCAQRAFGPYVRLCFVPFLGEF